MSVNRKFYSRVFNPYNIPSFAEIPIKDMCNDGGKMVTMLAPDETYTYVVTTNSPGDTVDFSFAIFGPNNVTLKRLGEVLTK